MQKEFKDELTQPEATHTKEKCGFKKVKEILTPPELMLPRDRVEAFEIKEILLPPNWMRPGFKVMVYGALALTHIYSMVPSEYKKYVLGYGYVAIASYNLVNAFRHNFLKSDIGKIVNNIPSWVRSGAKVTSCGLFALTCICSQVPSEYRKYVLMFGYTAIACYNLNNIFRHNRSGVNVPPLEPLGREVDIQQ